jgi:glutamate--cysteine ligase
MMIQDQIHKKIIDNCDEVCDWFDRKNINLGFPFYSSFDIRDSGEKVCPVDANIFPAGFNNICPQDKEASGAVFKKYIDAQYPNLKGPIALLSEEHTANAYYWENVRTIAELIRSSGREVHITVPRDLSKVAEVRSSSGEIIRVEPNERREGRLFIGGKPIDLIVCNNDFSDEKEEWSKNLITPMNPPRELGWYRRRKSEFFQEYNILAKEFSEVIQVDPMRLEIMTESFDEFDPDSEQSLNHLAEKVSVFFQRLTERYKSLGFTMKPYVYIKNNAGTYGMGVAKVSSAEEILSWNSKSRKKMRAAKGGRQVNSVILQEGIPTRYVQNNEYAEPCIYLVGCELVGGFLRTHSQKDAEDNLNSPGAVFKKLCMADLVHDQSDCPMENVYGWVAKLGAMAIANEAKKLGVSLPANGAGCK